MTKCIQFNKFISGNYSNFILHSGKHQLRVSEVNVKMKALKIGDQVLSIDEVNYRELNPEQWCETVENGLLKDKVEINITILRDNQEISFVLKELKLI
ncbi:hypothetical protein [Brumimicrobium mesophilum]|uniref:hypothetical protein n=1 Tax=Brumimicrobium mesophilum TaxID=392717 RepID=UPI000D141D43|nr:hypothetical protein [Brumimicrobium mesophilum]